MPKTEPPRVAVIGAGPVGLEAALYARACGCPVAVYEQGGIAEHLRHWGHVRMFTPFGHNVSPLGLAVLRRERPGHAVPADGDLLTGREFRDAYLIPLAESEPLLESLHLEHAVLAVGRASNGRSFRLLVRDPQGRERMDTADVVLDCSGVYGHPNPLGDGGIPAAGERAARPHIAYGLEDVTGERQVHYAGRSVLVVGDGYSAATTVCGLAALAEEHPATWVIWVSRGPRGQPLPRIPNDPYRERDRLAARANALATRCDGNLEFHAQTVLDEVVCAGPDQGFRVVGRSAGRPVVWEVDRVVANVGYRPDPGLTEALRPDEPGYFVLGAKSGGRGFLLRDAFDPIRRVFARILNNPRLDLYARKAA